MEYFFRYGWFRSLYLFFSNHRALFVRGNGVWRLLFSGGCYRDDYDEFCSVRPFKVDKVEGYWTNIVFCSVCGNDLIHSRSFVSTKELNNGLLFYNYCCSNCGKDSSVTFDLAPCAIHLEDLGSVIVD